MLPLGKICLFTICVGLFTFSATYAQNGYLSILDYNNLSISRIKNYPTVQEISFDNFINPTYDQNHHHYIFVGQGTNRAAFSLFTADVSNGNILDSPACYYGAVPATFSAIQYDNATDTLYAVYFDENKKFYFCWIDQVTGNVHIKNPIPGMWYFVEVSFDTRDNLFIMTNGGDLLALDASTGAIVYSYTFPNFISITSFDNRTGKLYGFSSGATQHLMDFDSITLATGQLHRISTMSNVGFPSIDAYAIDERNGRFIFVGVTSFSPSCSQDTLYVLDINDGTILSRQSYPDAEFPIATNEYVINFADDAQTGLLYALDWHPPAARSISVRAAATTICSGQRDTFTATAVNSSVMPGYQWVLNGNNVGTNDSVYVNTDPQDGDTVACFMASVSSCSISEILLSNKLTIKVIPANPSSVDITASANPICSGDTVLFAAAPVGGGDDPSYQWRINGAKAGTNSSGFSSSSLHDGDSVDCIMTGSIACSSPVLSNRLGTTVKPGVTVNMAADTVLRPGKSFQPDPIITGAIAGYRWTPATGLNNPSIPDPVVRPATSTSYRLTVTGDDGCEASGQIDVLVYFPLLMPGAFTPNGDGKNDEFRIPASTPQRIKSFSVYNRWGQRIFMTGNPLAGWNGTFHNQPQEPGPYVWKIEYVNLLNGVAAMESGVVLLIR